MFFHSLKYTFLTLMRDKSQVFWCFAFPLLLGTMFSFAFGNLGASETFAAIPVAVVMEEENEMKEIFDTLSEPGEDQFLDVTYCTDDEALSLLEEKAVYGIIQIDMPSEADYAVITDRSDLPDAPLTLTISGEMNSDPLYQSILSVFVEQINLQYHAIADIAFTDPLKLEQVLNTMADEASYLAKESLGAETLDESLTYFFNLIAMTCLYAAMGGSNIAIDNQANLSTLGAKRSISPVNKFVSTLGDLSALLIFEFLTIIIALLYFSMILGVNFGPRSGFVALTGLVGCFTGISLGFFIGSIGRYNKDTKFGILMAVIMIGCFLSGLMVGNMRAIVEDLCPVLNQVNPAALISDALYSLIIYPSYDRYFTNIVSLLILSALLCIGGATMMRRKKYASL